MAPANSTSRLPAPKEFTIDSVYPWGRSLEEYRRMFALSEEDLRLRILGCADGPASFNAEMILRGGRVVSCDPLYRFSAGQIRERIEKTADVHVERVRKHSELFVWERIKSPEEMRRLRLKAMDGFLADFPDGLGEGRYLDRSLPVLGFEDQSFDLAVCSHFLFLYSDVFSAEFHVESMVELCRVAREVRVFPLVDMNAERSIHLEPVTKELRARGFDCRIEKVDYEFQRGGNEMLRVDRRV